MSALFIPARSPLGLIQESLFPNEWLILVSCMMLNCTSRKQVERVFPEFIKRWPTPGVFMGADLVEVAELCKPLGFANRRTQNIKKMTERYVAAPWTHARELPGIGEYAARAWEIFCNNELGTETPNDGALSRYHAWRVKHEQRKEDP